MNQIVFDKIPGNILRNFCIVATPEASTIMMMAQQIFNTCSFNRFSCSIFSRHYNDDNTIQNEKKNPTVPIIIFHSRITAWCKASSTVFFFVFWEKEIKWNLCSLPELIEVSAHCMVLNDAPSSNHWLYLTSVNWWKLFEICHTMNWWMFENRVTTIKIIGVVR